MHVLVFEDEQTEQLAPITTSRPAYSITCASFRLIDLLRRLDLPIAGHVRTHLKPLQTADFPDLVSIDAVVEKPETLLAINARAIPSKANDEAIQQLIASGKPGVVKCDDAVAAMLLSEQEVSNLNLGGESSDPANPIASLLEAASASNVLDTTISLFAWPHEVVREHMTLMNESLEHRLASGNYVQQQDGVFLAPGATLGEYAIVDTSEGPILLDSDVQVGPFCYLSGPVYAGPNTRVIEHSALKDGVTLGHTTKIGGEVEASIIEPYTNKQHHGFLGHSYLGSWINLGAGTCNSDLKNTYGKINIEYNGRRVPSEMQFLGCIAGDYSKTAINTGIFTGKVIGVCSMLYGFVTQNVASFMNYAQIFGQVAEIPPEVLIATQARMFARRKVQQRECDMQLIRDMYTATTHERERLNQIGTL